MQRIIFVVWVLQFAFASVGHSRPSFQDHPTALRGYVGEATQVDLVSLLKDAGSGNLVWTLLQNPPPFVEIRQGKLSVDASAASIGNYTFALSVTEEGSDAGDITQVVLRVKYRVKWKQNPLNFGEQFTGKDFSVNLSNYVENPLGETLLFQASQLPSWMVLDTTGRIRGTPSSQHQGNYQFGLSVSTAGDPWDDTVAKGKVLPFTNKPPVWLVDPVQMGKFILGDSVDYDLLPLVEDPDGDALSFKLVQGPSWLKVSKNGKVSGTSPVAGSYAALIEVSDPYYAASAGAFVEFIPKNSPPVIELEALSFIVKAGQKLSVNINTPKYVHDPNGDPLTFKLLGPVDWMTLSPQGALEILGKQSNVGSHKIPIRVSELTSNPLSTDGVITVTVLSADPPTWLENPIVFDGRVGEAFSESLSAKAKDPAGLSLQFSIQGPGWLSSSLAGALSGVPSENDAGKNSFEARVENAAGLSAVTTLIVNVKGGVQQDQWVVDSAGAPSEILWVANYTTATQTLMHFLQREIGAFFDELNRAGLHWVMVYQSANPYWHGYPILGKSGSPFMRWDDTDLVQDFGDRAWGGWVLDDTGASPLWAMNCFYGVGTDPTAGCELGVNGSQDIYHNGFIERAVPHDVLIVNSELDLYGSWARKTSKKDWTPSEYGIAFEQYHQREEKNLRVSTLGYRCRGCRAVPAAHVISKMTGGEIYNIGKKFNFEDTLRAYAQTIVRRATLNKIRFVSLTKTPLAPEKLEVRVQSVLLEPSQWKYHPTTNKVEIFWEVLDGSLSMPGARIQISYQW